MTTPSQIEQANRAERFRALHQQGTPLLMPNAWDVGSAALFATLGFEALATTSGGFAATHGRPDGGVTREEVLTHSAELSGAVGVPVSADLENCFADDPEGVAATIRAAIDTGLAGGSVEDFTRAAENPIYELSYAAERVAAAAEAAHAGPVPFVLTARAENYLHHRRDLDDTIVRLQAYQEAGADVLFAPFVIDRDELRQLLASVDRPVSVLVAPHAPTVGELADMGVSRISVGSAVAMAAYGAAINAVNELREQGTYAFWELVAVAGPVLRDTFSR